MMRLLEKGRIVAKGMGGFLNPPSHPEHTHSVEINLRRRPWNRGSMSLSSAAENMSLEASIRESAKAMLANWVPPNLDRPEIQDWVRQVLGYFRNCYRGSTFPEPDCWYACNMLITEVPEAHAVDPVNDHAGVHYIRKFYPAFQLEPVHVAEAYWGEKKVPTEPA